MGNRHGDGRSRAELFKVAGVVVGIIGFALWIGAFVAGRYGGGYGAFISLAGFLVGGALLLASSKLFLHGKKHTVPSALDRLAADPRPPVLYLRSFSDDTFNAEPKNARLPFLPSFITREELLMKVLEASGPTVAIGKPGEVLPKLGAARLYVSDDGEWRDLVAQLMRRAGLVVFRAGQSQGLLWEESLALATLRPEQIVFVLPDDAVTYRALRARVNPRVNFQLPAFDEWEESEWEESDRAELRAILYFEERWKPRMVDLFHIQDGVSERTLRRALQPVFDQVRGQDRSFASGRATSPENPRTGSERNGAS